MILIEVNNKEAKSNFQLLEETEKWAKENVKGEYTIILDPNLKEPMRITATGNGTQLEALDFLATQAQELDMGYETPKSNIRKLTEEEWIKAEQAK